MSEPKSLWAKRSWSTCHLSHSPPLPKPYLKRRCLTHERPLILVVLIPREENLVKKGRLTVCFATHSYVLLHLNKISLCSGRKLNSERAQGNKQVDLMRINI